MKIRCSSFAVSPPCADTFIRFSRQNISLIFSYPDFEVVGEAEDGRESIRCVEQLKPDMGALPVC